MSNNENQWIVHVYAVARVPIAVARDKATTPEEAIAKAVEAFYENRGLRSVIVDRPDDPMAPEDGEEITGFCVDHPGDTEYQGSQFFCADGKTEAWDSETGHPRCDICARTLCTKAT